MKSKNQEKMSKYIQRNHLIGFKKVNKLFNNPKWPKIKKLNQLICSQISKSRSNPSKNEEKANLKWVSFCTKTNVKN